MAGQKGRTGHCYRCIHSWTIRGTRRPRVCPRCKSSVYDVPKLRPVTLGRGLGIEEILHPHREDILRAARRHGAAAVWVFGSVRRREATQGSDVDLLVRWARPHSLLDRAELAQEIEDLVGRPVEIVNEGGLHWAIEPQVESEKVPL
jgi:uncharacterized protein